MATASRKPKTASTATKPKPRERAEWHLVCVTRLGKVSMLQNLTATVARETYKRLKPDEHPEEHIFPNCKTCGQYGWSWSEHGRTYGPHDDWLDEVSIIGPVGKTLDPWAGVEPHIVDMTHLCRCGRKPSAGWMKPGEAAIRNALAKSAAEPRRESWDRKRSDFWNNPRLWDRVKDPFKQMCWEAVR